MSTTDTANLTELLYEFHNGIRYKRIELGMINVTIPSSGITEVG